MIKYNFIVSNILFIIKSKKEIPGIDNLIKHYENSNKFLVKKKVVIIISELKNNQYIKFHKKFKKKEKIEYFVKKLLYKHKNNFLIENEKIIIKKLKSKKISLKTASFKTCSTSLLRLIREYIYRYYEKKGFICFHAAGIKIKKNTCMILGASGTGKTTLLCKLAETGALPFSNDRLLINSNREIQTIPLHYRIGYGTLINSEKLLNFYLNNLPNLYKFHIFEISKIDVLNRYSDGYFENKKLELTQLEIEECFGVNKFILSDKLTHIIIPELTLIPNTFKIKTLDKKETINILLDEKYTPNDKNWKENWIINPNYDQFNYFDIIKNIINNVKIIKVVFSPEKAKNLILYLEEKHE